MSTLTIGTSSRQRMFALDTLRGLAAVLVLVRHAPVIDGVTISGPVESVFGFCREVGWIGVDLFFVLSGFLITLLILSEIDETGRFQFGRFWLKRALKIWPSYFAAYGSVALLWCIRDHWRGDQERVMDNLHDVIVNATFLQNYLHCRPWPHSWTLAVEEQFYTIYPFVLLVLFRFCRIRCWSSQTRAGVVIFTWGTIAASVLACRCWAFSSDGSWHANYYRSHLRADSLAFGALLAFAYCYSRTVRRRLISAWPQIVVLAILATCLPYVYPLETSWQCSTFGFTVLYAAFGGLTFSAAIRPDAGRSGSLTVRLPAAALAWVGVYSYTIYLAHSVIYAIPGAETVRQGLLTQAEYFLGSAAVLVWFDRGLFWMLSIGGGVLLSHAVERPFLRLRSRWFLRSAMTEVVSPVGGVARAVSS